MNSIIKYIPKDIVFILKSFYLNFISIFDYIYDYKRFKKYSTSTVKYENYQKLISKIVMHYHVIEKGLTLKKPRLGFGKEKIEILISLIDKYIEKEYPLKDTNFLSAISVLNDYVKYHKEHLFDINDLENKLKKYLTYFNDLGGRLEISRSDIMVNITSNFDDFSKSRHSVRNFSSDKVEIESIYKAIEIAQKSPSVCNRQTSKVYIIQDNNKKEAIVNLQNGNRGFGEFADKYLVVTSDLNKFWQIGERNQSFIDGGIFSMSLLYGLHYMGLACCTLNWAVSKNKDKKLKKVLNIPDNENIILIIAVGHYPEKLVVCKSNRLVATKVSELI
jgi:nitroreductase